MITAIQASKGGVGKTTSTSILSSICGISGQRTLIIDMDYQKNLTELMAADLSLKPKVPLSDLIMKPFSLEEIQEAIVPTKVPNVSLIPADDLIHSLPYMLHDEITHNGNEFIVNYLRNNLIQVAGPMYQQIFIDTSPALTYLSTVSTLAADFTLIPIEADNLSYQSVISVLKLIEDTTRYYKCDKKKKGAVFMTRVNPRTTRMKEMSAGYQKILGDTFLPIYIKASETVGRANTSFTPLILADKKCDTINEYISLLQALDMISGEQFLKIKKYQRYGTIDEIEEENTKNE